MSRTDWILAITAVLVTVGVFVAVFQMNSGLSSSIGVVGWFAYAMGALMSIAVAGGLFFLTFYSARNGYDNLDRPDDDSPS
ncbi:MAG: hypothetical protein AAGJ32_07875 [Pseudomonadota bacterium]